MAITFVKTAAGTNNVATVAITPATIGNLLIAVVYASSATNVTLADTAGNSWSPICGGFKNVGGVCLAAWVCSANGTSSTTATATLTGGTCGGVSISEFSGANITPDASNNGSGTASPSLATSGNLTTNSDMVWAAGQFVNGLANPTVGTINSTTAIATTTITGSFVTLAEYIILTSGSGSTATATVTSSGTGSYTMFVAAFSASAIIDVTMFGRWLIF